MKQLKAYVVSNNRILPGMARPRGRSILGSYLLRLHCPEIAAEAKPGQFVMVRPDSVGIGILPRPFSVHEATADDITLFFAVLEGGKGTRWLSQRQDNEEVELFGPLGNGFSIRPGARNLLLVAGGIGIAPLRFLADEAIAQNKEVTLLMGANSAVHLLPTQSSNRGLLTDGVLPWKITIHKSTDDGSEGYKGLVTQLLIERRFIDQADQIFACGPTAMYKAMAQMTELRGKPVQVSLETVMGCGRGVCYGCTVNTKNGIREVCTDGPVFELDDILWDEVDL